ncbi:MAG: hypothetical protein J4G03_08915, partial [Gemmatimonadetes bacterium]|nr:hypothetical protein [Gemmatimonadota bacterium]
MMSIFALRSPSLSARRIRSFGLRAVVLLVAAACADSPNEPIEGELPDEPIEGELPDEPIEITELPRELSAAEVEIMGAGNR